MPDAKAPLPLPLSLGTAHYDSLGHESDIHVPIYSLMHQIFMKPCYVSESALEAVITGIC